MKTSNAILTIFFLICCITTGPVINSQAADVAVHCQLDIDQDGDVDGADLAELARYPAIGDIQDFAEIFGQTHACETRIDGIIKNWHPRLLVLGENQQTCEADLNRVKSQFQPEGLYHHAYTQAVLVGAQGNSGRFGADFMLKMVTALGNETQQGQLINEAKTATQSGNYYIEPYQVFFILAMFDWFRTAWNETETERLITYMKDVVRRNEWSPKTVLGNHFHEDHAITRILPGLVLAGETAGGQDGSDLWYGYGTGSLGIKGAKFWMKDQLVPTFNDLFGTFGMSPEGNAYWAKGHPYLPALAMAWSSCTDEDLFQEWSMTDFSKSLIYSWRPLDGKLLPWGDGVARIGVFDRTNRSQIYGGAYKTPFSVFLPLMRWKNSREASFIYNLHQIPDYLEGIDFGDTGTDYGDIFVRYIFGDAFGPRNQEGAPLNDPEPLDVETLPKSVYLDGHNSVVIRSGWGENDVLFGYKQNKYIAGHDNADAGSFVISKNEDLAMDSGYYSSNGDVLDQHTMYYSPRTIAHNTVTVVKPGQYTHVQYWSNARNIPNDDGGQKGFGGFWNEGTSPSSYMPPFLYDDFLESRFDRGTINRFEYTPSLGFTYFTGDVTPAYYTDSVSNFTRTVLSPDAAYFIILDRVSTVEPDYPKRWLLHTENQPIAINGTIGEQNPGDGSMVFTGNQFYAQNGSNRLFVKMLIPDNNQADTVLFRGGPGYEYWYGYDETGFNADQVHDVPDSMENPGNWRIEEKISGQGESVFLNVLYATESNTMNMGTAQLLDSNEAVFVVALNDYICVFSRTETKTGQYKNDFNYTVDTIPEKRHILTDLYSEALYSVYEDGMPLAGSPFLSSSSGIISFLANGAHTYHVVSE